MFKKIKKCHSGRIIFASRKFLEFQKGFPRNDNKQLQILREEQ